MCFTKRSKSRPAPKMFSWFRRLQNQPWIRQTLALVKKNFLFIKRDPRSLFYLVVVPPIYLIVIVILVRVVPIVKYPAWVEPVPNPVPLTSNMYLGFIPGDSQLALDLMTSITNCSSCIFRHQSLLPLKNESQIYEYLNETYAVVEFLDIDPCLIFNDRDHSN